MNKPFLLFTAFFIALVACLITASSSAYAMEEFEQTCQKSLPTQRATEIPLDKGERLYTTTRRINEPWPYERASDVFKTKLRLCKKEDVTPPSSLNDIILLKAEPLTACLICQPKYQHILRTSMNDAMLHYSGNVLFEVPKEELEKDLLMYIAAIDFQRSTPLARMLSLREMVKSGCVEGVKNLTQRLLEINQDELFNYNKILLGKDPSYNNHVPIFWLPAIVTRWDEENVPDENYQKIEEYLCGILCPSGQAKVDGKIFTREEFVKATNEWKAKENKDLGFDRHQLPLSFVSNLNK